MGTFGEVAWAALAEGGLLPSAAERPHEAIGDSPAEDLLPSLAHAWERAIATGANTRHGSAAKMGGRLKEWQEQGARLTWGVPGAVPPADQWLGQRLAWWPDGIPAGRRVGLVSSRLGRALDAEQSWFTVFRAACGRIDRQRDLLLVAASTTTARYAQRSAALFRLPALLIDTAEPDTMPLDKWFARVTDRRAREKPADFRRLFLSPPVTADPESPDEALRGIPVRDRAMVALSDRLFAFRIRRGGQIHDLIRRRLADPAWPAATVYVALGPQLVRTEMADELMDCGAVGWVVLPAEDDSISPATGKSSRKPIPAHADASPAADAPAQQPERLRIRASVIAAFPPAENWPFLTHCTRRRDGPWPDQEDADYLDDLILARGEADHSALAALKRMLRQQRILATAQTIRGAAAVVSLTAVPLAELHRLRVFRPHRGRWDFEPYGVCIRRNWLEALGARAVVYGDDQLWQRLSPDERPFFQLHKTRRMRGSRPIDWTVEDEWRVVGDIDLSQLPHGGALIFVRTPGEARDVAPLSRWPVTVVPA